jgi:hypothetical protein
MRGSVRRCALCLSSCTTCALRRQRVRLRSLVHWTLTRQVFAGAHGRTSSASEWLLRAAQRFAPQRNMAWANTRLDRTTLAFAIVAAQASDVVRTASPRRGGLSVGSLKAARTVVVLRSARSVLGLQGSAATSRGVAHRQQLLERRGAGSDLAVVLRDRVVAGIESLQRWARRRAGGDTVALIARRLAVNLGARGCLD